MSFIEGELQAVLTGLKASLHFADLQFTSNS